LTETTYHEKKLYIPAEIREKLGLKSGEKTGKVSRSSCRGNSPKRS
jgi:hypothetical protein